MFSGLVHIVDKAKLTCARFMIADFLEMYSAFHVVSTPIARWEMVPPSSDSNYSRDRVRLSLGEVNPSARSSASGHRSSLSFMRVDYQSKKPLGRRLLSLWPHQVLRIPCQPQAHVRPRPTGIHSPISPLSPSLSPCPPSSHQYHDNRTPQTQTQFISQLRTYRARYRADFRRDGTSRTMQLHDPAIMSLAPPPDFHLPTPTTQ
jgi:hypothetical protein